ncbi:MAG: Ig-like domain-containing protein [Bacteroidales bacterium]|nr:Ig-like domain-containing protein [Bacteroidales bacterium]
MGSTRKKNGEIFKFTENWNIQFKQLKENFNIGRNHHSWLKNSMWFFMLLLATMMWQCAKDDFDGETIGVCPEVNSTDPANGAINVVTDKIITATFNEVMDPSTINETTFLLKNGLTLITGTVSFSDKVATFTPASLLAANTVYTGVITTGSRDLAGNALVEDYTWNFNTGNVPIVVTTDPENGASNVALGKTVTAVFSTSMNSSTINSLTFKLKKGTVSILGSVTYIGMTASFDPSANLAENSVYTATITDGAKDVSGNALTKDTTWSFSTGALPKVITTDPVQGASNVALNKLVKVGFSKSMNTATINAATFLVKEGTVNIAGSYSTIGAVTTFDPTIDLLPNTEYTCTVNTGAQDASGYALAKDTTWSFTTNAAFSIVLTSSPSIGGSTLGGGSYLAGAMVTAKAIGNVGYKFVNWTEAGNEVSVYAEFSFLVTGSRTLVANFTALASGPDYINLRSAGNFAVLGGSGVSNTGVNTMITGDVGAFPTGTINGLLPGNVNGILYTTADPIVGVAIADLTTAYNDAQGRSLNAISLPGQVGGLTLVPGLYVNSISSGISGTGTNGILTLDAGGNANAVWIFKMGSTLVTDAGTSIVLAGGAQAKNIYWSVGSSATLGTNSIFYGNILADQSITLTTGAKLYGRALTRIGAVTLDENTVVKPQ